MITHNEYEDLIKNSIGKKFTMTEAIQFEIMMQSAPTGTTSKYQWKNIETGRPINFSYNDNSTKK